MSKKYLFIFSCALLLVLFMGYRFQRDGGSMDIAKQTRQMNVTAEVETWKTELVAQKLVGTPCRFAALDTPDADRWRQENPDQMNGLPLDDKEIGTAQSDFDGDGKPDLLLYLNSQNCSGRNGGTPWFAKIIYATGTANANVVSDIREAMFEAYKKMHTSNPSLKQVTRDYSDDTISVSYVQKVGGAFQLYAKGDAHCCPSYEGTYTYEPHSKQINLNISEIKK